MPEDAVASRLSEFLAKQGKIPKGRVFAACIVGDLARRESMTWPLDPDLFTTGEGNGQVRGMGGAAIRAILEPYGVKLPGSSEGGRTSRGTVGFMREYVAFLNSLHEDFAEENDLNLLETAEGFWVAVIKDKLAEKPFSFVLDASKGLRSAVRELIELARERSGDGTHVHGTVAQHLVGAKLDLLLDADAGELGLKHNKSNTKDDGLARDGDFSVGDAVIHVTVNPSIALVEKCKANLSTGFRPIILTTYDGLVKAENFAEGLGIKDRVDVFDIEQFVAANIYEWSQFDGARRRPTVEELVTRYNEIVLACEGDKSLTIVLK